MSRFVKVGKTKEQLYEIVRIGTRLFSIESTRAVGDKTWEIDAKHRRGWAFASEDEAIAERDKRIADFTGKKKYTAAGDRAPFAMAHALHSRTEALGKLPDDATTAMRERFAAAKHLAWVHADGSTQTFTLDGVNIVTETNGEKRTHFFPSLDRALNYAAVEMHVLHDQAEFTERT